jgi:formate dehydrogenase major subunit
LALGGVLALSTVKAAAQNLKLSNVREFTTSCNFCSCGCGMVAAVREGKLITMEGDYDHIVNRGSLCVKGISMFATHTSPNRLTTPRYRAPGSDHWEEISWDDAIMRVAHKIRKTRCDLDCHVWPLMVLVIGLIVTRPGPATNEVTKF